MSEITKDYTKVWNKCLGMIHDIVEEDAYETWFLPIVPVSLEEDTLVLQLPSHLFYEFLEEHYVNVLKSVIKKEIGPMAKLKYKVIMEQQPDPAQSQTITLPSHNRPAVSNPPSLAPIDVYQTPNRDIPDPFVLPGIQKHKIPSNLVETLTFDNYIEGDCNRLARSAGWAIAKAPGQTSFNPLFIYSDVGLGKTHLANAIGIQTKINHPDKTVVYVSCDTFYQQYVEALRNKNINDFIWFYQQSVDMLIIDDIQFIAGGKGKTQEAFFHIFNSLHQHNKQIIITSDKSPVEITGFEPRLLNRFKWGLTADLQVPDLETRIAIINKKLENNGITFPKEVVEYLALRITSNTRELEGAMIAILAQASLNHRAITVDLAKEMVDKYVKTNAKEISIEYIQKIVCDYFKISAEAINARTRRRDIVQARQLSMYFAKKYTKLPLTIIGAYCGNKDHATVLHACRTISNLYETDKKMKLYVDDIDKKMKI
ncbi:MAG: chromosomal replication initiator protein DnaA [Bacteroidales bacterium]|jgi:chromosomal replication initiator protein DnaA|nr:chromosomal replication initiator protein DnaA [Bacteroidales bacterium]